MGEIYEVVVFTASLSKVRMNDVFGRGLPNTALMYRSTPIQYLINWIYIEWSGIDYSGRVATTTEGITSRSVLRIFCSLRVVHSKKRQDLSQLGRPIGETIIIDNSPASYIFHPKNAVPVSSWFNDPHGALRSCFSQTVLIEVFHMDAQTLN